MTVIVGNRDVFAIECEINEELDSALLGPFRFWLRGCAVGNWEDAAYLNGCVNWLRDFAENPRDRFEPTLTSKSKEEIFRLLVEPVMAGPNAVPWDEMSIFQKTAFPRFHIQHFGMSSFDKYYIVLIVDAEGTERCIWQAEEGAPIMEAVLPPGEMERVAREFCNRFDDELRSFRYRNQQR